MRAITVTQPWASLLICGAKRIETRSWATRYRGLLAIHAAKGWSAEDRRFALSREVVAHLGYEELPLGALVGFTSLVACVPTERIDSSIGLSPQERMFGNFEPERHGWVMSGSVTRLARPIPCRGALGLWKLPPAVVARVREEVGDRGTDLHAALGRL